MIFLTEWKEAGLTQVLECTSQMDILQEGASAMSVGSPWNQNHVLLKKWTFAFL